MIFSCQVSQNKSSGEKNNSYGYFLNTRPGKRPNFYMKVNVTEESRKEFAALCMLRCVLLPPEKKGHGETTVVLLGKGEFPSEHHSIPFSPYFHVYVCLYGSMLELQAEL